LKRSRGTVRVRSTTKKRAEGFTDFMDFELNEEQQQIKSSVREFAEGEIAPHVREWDESQHFPVELLPKLAEQGFMGVIFPDEYGGAGMGYVEYVTIIEELSRVDGSVGISVAAHNSLCSNHIYIFGTEEQKRRFLAPLARGEKLGAWGLTEPQAGSDASGTRTTAVRRGDEWVVNGSKNFITHAIHADTCVAMASTDRAMRSKGITAFIFEKGMAGFSPGKKEDKLGLRASETASVIFEDCRVPDANRLGPEGLGFIQAMQVLDGGRISIAALALGIAQGAYESALRYSKERYQFGQPISNFEAIQFKLADMATQIDAARLLTYRAATLKDAGRKVTKESSMAKLYASEVAVRVSEEAIQIHGGYGYTKDYPPEKYWRDSKLCTIGEGTSEIQRLIIAKQILNSV
jgi:alkylation response protein AidB-like acyl-CoA dehydrogenase